jgi:hypothetical protein
VSAFDNPRCGARRPGWDRPDAGPFDRMPCVLAVEHEAHGMPQHRDALAQRWFGSNTLVSALGVALASEYVRALFGEEVPR